MSIWTIVVLVIMLGILVTVHELGHFFIARLLGIKVFEVSIFVGPALVTWRKNDVEYSIRCIPFGAYVRFTDIDEKGEPIEDDNDPKLLVNNSRIKRLLVALAGPFMNLVLGVVLALVSACIFGFYTTRVYEPFESTQLAMASSQFEEGDEVVRIDGRRVYTYLDIQFELDGSYSSAEDMLIEFRSSRTGELYEANLVPVITERPMLGIVHSADTDNNYNGWHISEVLEQHNGGDPILQIGDYLTAVDGISVTDENFEEHFASLTEGNTMHLEFYRNGEFMEADCIKTMIRSSNDRGVDVMGEAVNSFDSFVDALEFSVKLPLTVLNITVRSIEEAFAGEVEAYNVVSGPVGVADSVSTVVDNVDTSTTVKVYNILFLTTVLSLGLVITNMLPIPGLDGVQVILLLIEMVIGRKLSKKAELIINGIGFVLLIGLVIFALVSDVIRIIVGG